MRVDLVWLAAALLTVLLGFWWIPGEPATTTDSLSYSAAGKRAVVSLAERLFAAVLRSGATLPPRTPEAGTLAIIGPLRYPSEREWQRLARWVARGHNLVFAAREESPGVVLAGFGLAVEPGEYSAEAAQSRFGDGEIPWTSSARVVGDAPMEVVVWRGEEPQVVRSRVGAGAVVVVASDYVFRNRSLAREDSSYAAYRILLLGMREGAALAFDETLNRSGTPRVIGLLFDPALRPLTLQLILCALLALWMGSRRFGAPAAPASAARRSILEHARALGHLHRRAGTGAHLLRHYLEWFSEGLRGRYGAAAARLSPAAIARGARRGEEAVAELLERANELSRSPHAPAAEVAAAVRSLAELRQALEHVGPGS